MDTCDYNHRRMFIQKNILMFIDSIGYGGAQNQFVNLAVLLKQQGYNVKILVIYDEYDFYKSALDGIEILCDQKSKKHFQRVFRIPKLIVQQKPDIVIAYLDSQCELACIAKIFSKFKLIVSERNTTQHLGWKERIKFWLFRFADYIVPNSYTQGCFIAKLKPRSKEKIKVITNAIDLKRFYPSELHRNNNIPQIISVGRNTYQKNYLGMIEVIKILKERDIKAHFNWYAGECEANYQKIVYDNIKKYGLEGLITIYEPTQNIGDKYRESDFFWLYSFYEGFPNVLCEAMACGLPVACSDVCDNGNIVKEGENGVLAAPNNYVEMADQLCKLISYDEQKLKLISETNVRKVKTLCSDKAFLDKYLELING